MNNDAPLPDDLPPAVVDGSHCSLHPYRPNLGGGICASCLKEKLGKLVSSSSFPLPLHRPSSSSSSAASSPPSSDLSYSKHPNLVYERSHSRRAKIPSFLYSKKKKNRKCHSPSSAVPDRAAELTLRRSNTAPKRPEHLGRFLDGDILEFSPRKKGFWSFLYLSAGNHPLAAASRQHHSAPNNSAPNNSAPSSSSTSAVRADMTMAFSNDGSKRCSDVIPEDDDVGGVACDGNNFERKVSRSRSVGCGSRRFSGDIFERISTGFGDCTFRRVESLRETDGQGHTRHRFSTANTDYRMKERVKCGRIFGGFMTASSSSFLSSSSYLISTSSTKGHPHRGAYGVRSAVPAVDGLNGRSRSWGGWVFASPMRAFGRPSSSKDVKSCNATPNLNAIPSLLTVGG